MPNWNKRRIHPLHRNVIETEGEVEKMERYHEWYIPVSQAADILGCHRRAVYELMEQGRLAWIRMPRNQVRVCTLSVDRLLGGKTATTH